MIPRCRFWSLFSQTPSRASFFLPLFFLFFLLFFLATHASAKPPILRSNSLPTLSNATYQQQEDIAVPKKAVYVASAPRYQQLAKRRRSQREFQNPILLSTERQLSASSSEGSEGYYSGSDSDLSPLSSLESYHLEPDIYPTKEDRARENAEHYQDLLVKLIEELQRLKLHERPRVSKTAPDFYSDQAIAPQNELRFRPSSQVVASNSLSKAYSFYALGEKERMEELAGIFWKLSIDGKKKATGIIPMMGAKDESPPAEPQCKKHCSEALDKFVEVSGLLTRGAIFIGGSILVFYYPPQTVQATILVADPAQSSPYSGRIIDYSLCDRNYLATSMRLLLIMIPPIIDSFVLKLSELIKKLCDRTGSGHVCCGEDCIMVQNLQGDSSCLLKDLATHKFVYSAKRLDIEQQFLVMCILSNIANHPPPPKKKLPNSATPGEIVENLIVRRDWKYLVHTISYSAYCAVAGAYIIFGNNLETAVITLVADATVEQNNTELFANQTQRAITVSGEVSDYTPELTPYIISAMSLFSVYYLTPKILPLLQRFCSYVYNKYSSRKSYRKRKSSPNWV